MKPIDEMTQEEQSLLLHLEDRLFKNHGLCLARNFLQRDLRTMAEWKDAGHIQFGPLPNAPVPGFWVRLSDEAWRRAGELRQAQAQAFIDVYERQHPERAVSYLITLADKQAAEPPKPTKSPRLDTCALCGGPNDSCEHALRS